MARIYTRTGDTGETSLGDGSRVSKSQARVDLYGDVDELNSLLGVAVATLVADVNLKRVGKLDLASELQQIQSRLFDLGTLLANPTLCLEVQQSQRQMAFTQGALEDLIDILDEDIEPLKQFILPGGHAAAAQLHVTRTVCRRVERKCVQLASVDTIPATAVAWLNRLSDFLFTAARGVNAAAGIPDIPWTSADSSTEA